MNLVRYFEDGFRVGLLAKEGTKHLHIVTLAHPIDVIKRPVDDDMAIEYLDGDSEELRRKFLNLSKTLGITERAKRLLETSTNP